MPSLIVTQAHGTRLTAGCKFVSSCHQGRGRRESKSILPEDRNLQSSLLRQAVERIVIFRRRQICFITPLGIVIIGLESFSLRGFPGIQNKRDRLVWVASNSPVLSYPAIVSHGKLYVRRCVFSDLKACLLIYHGHALPHNRSQAPPPPIFGWRYSTSFLRFPAPSPNMPWRFPRMPLTLQVNQSILTA